MKMECDTVFRRKTNGLWPPSPYITEDTLICGHVLVEVSIWDVRQREHSKITLSTQPRINVGFKHLCLVLNRTLCMFHNFTWDDHPKLAHMFWEWLNRPAEWTFSRARCVDEAQITGGKNAINTWLKLGSHWSACYLWMIGIGMMSVTESTYTKKVAEFTPRFTLFGLTAHVIIQNWIFTFRLAVRSLHFLMICSNCFWWYLSFGHSNMESWMSKCICGGHTKTHDMAGKKGFAI